MKITALALALAVALFAPTGASAKSVVFMEALFSPQAEKPLAAGSTVCSVETAQGQRVCIERVWGEASDDDAFEDRVFWPLASEYSPLRADPTFARVIASLQK